MPENAEPHPPWRAEHEDGPAAARPTADTRAISTQARTAAQGETAGVASEPANAIDDTSRPTRVGLVGIGRMGEAIGHRLLGTGHPLVLHNRTEAKAAGLLAAGAEWAASPAEVADLADVVLTPLFDERAAREVYLGESGLFSATGSDVLLVEMSTIRTATSLALRDATLARGLRLMDAALVGPPAAALAGRLLVLAGAEDADLARAGPVLDAISRRVAHLGPVGSGVTMKLVLMHSVGGYFAALAEAFAVGRQLGLPADTMLDVILDSHGAPPVLRDRAEALLAELDGEQVTVGFPVAGVRKDLEAVVSTASDAGVSAPVAASALASFTAAPGPASPSTT